MNNHKTSYNWPLILAYHSISEMRQDSLAVHPADFQAHIEWLHHRGYRSITLAQFMGQTYTPGNRVVIITFDDGYEDNYSLAFPIMKRYGFIATIFLVSDYVNTDHFFYWDVPKISSDQDPALFRILKWDQVNEMANYGIEFGSHTCTHPELPSLSTNELTDEICRSRQDLQARLGKDVVSFCYPRGKLSHGVVDIVEKAGYHCAVLTSNRAGIPFGPFTLRRVGIYHHITPWLFRIKTNYLVRRYYEHLLPRQAAAS